MNNLKKISYNKKNAWKYLNFQAYIKRTIPYDWEEIIHVTKLVTKQTRNELFYDK